MDAQAAAAAANSSSDFVCTFDYLQMERRLANAVPGAKAVQVWIQPMLVVVPYILHTTNRIPRMLEDPSYESVVRWANEGDSFVVLEVSQSQGSAIVQYTDPN